MTLEMTKPVKKIYLFVKRIMGSKPKIFIKRLKQKVPPPGFLYFGSLRRLKPISSSYGFDRGKPIDRYYIENFLQLHSEDIQGKGLEIGDDIYTKQFGKNLVIKSEVLHVSHENPFATIIADLSKTTNIPSDSFNFAIITQTLHLIYDIKAAIQTLHRILKPGGVLLATLPGLSQMADPEWNDSWYWGLTRHSAKKLFGDVFGIENIEVNAYGNVLTSIAFLHGIATEEFRKAELDYRDPSYDLLVTVRAIKQWKKE